MDFCNTIVSEVLTRLTQSNPHIECMQRKNAVVYGSIIWRIIDKAMRMKENCPLRLMPELIRSVLADLDRTNATQERPDIDVFTEMPIDNEHTFESDYAWLAYSIDDAAAQEFLENQPVFPPGSSAVEIQRILSEQRQKIAERMLCKTRTTKFLTFASFGGEYHICINHSHLNERPTASNSPADLLTTQFAPYFTVESLAWSRDRGLFARYCDLQTAIDDVQSKTMRLINCHKVEKFVGEHWLMDIAMLRFVKYRRYGFKLVLPDEYRTSAFVTEMIQRAMLEFISQRSIPHKKMICIGAILPAEEQAADPKFAADHANALAAHELHADYITEIASDHVDSDCAALIAEYAARRDEDVYHEDRHRAALILEARAELHRLIWDS